MIPSKWKALQRGVSAVGSTLPGQYLRSSGDYHRVCISLRSRPIARTVERRLLNLRLVFSSYVYLRLRHPTILRKFS